MEVFEPTREFGRYCEVEEALRYWHFEVSLAERGEYPVSFLILHNLYIEIINAANRVLVLRIKVFRNAHRKHNTPLFAGKLNSFLDVFSIRY